MYGKLSCGRLVLRMILEKQAFFIHSMPVLFMDKFYHNITAWQARSMRLQFDNYHLVLFLDMKVL
jgi:hypothetical protein